MPLMELNAKALPAILRGPRTERRRLLVNDSACWASVRGDGSLALDGQTVTHLPPCEPTKINCVHLIYSSRGIESRNTATPTETPTYFMKPVTALNGHGGELVKPADCTYLNYEGEFPAVIGKVCRNVTPDEAWDYVAGFAPALGMGLQNLRTTDRGSVLRLKSADGLLPIGPGLVRGVKFFEQTLRTYRNGLVVQEARIGEEMIWGPHYMIADIACHITLVAGDVILTGTPCHSRSLDVGDLIEVEISSLGRLASRVLAGPVPRAAARGVGDAPADSAEVRRVARGTDERVLERMLSACRRASLEGKDGGRP